MDVVLNTNDLQQALPTPKDIHQLAVPQAESLVF